MKTSSPLAHWYLGLINCGVAAVLFTAEVSAGGIGISNPPLINVNFGGHLTPAGLNINKVGIAAIGQATNDLWNFYSRDVAPGQWRQNGAITNLQQADGGTTAAGLVVNNLPGAWYNGSSDTMYNGYLYPQSGTASVELTNLPAGRYEVYLYSGQGNFQLQVGSTNYGTLTTFDVPVTNPPAWQAGVQYARFTNVQVAAGQAVKVSLLPGAGGGPCISGLQVLQSAPSTPLTITVQPAGRTVFEGADVAFQVTATGTYPLKYQWSFNGTNLPAATSDTLVVASAAISAAGLYSVRVTNTEGAITSTAAPLTVVRFASNALINVNFGGHLTPEGLSSNKVGVAASGQTTNDLWNFYSRDTASGQWKQDGALSSLQRADGAVTAAGIEVHNLAGAWYNGAIDTMYHGYLYPQSGNATLLVTNLPAGQYDVYLYSGQGNFQLQVGSVDYGVRTTYDVPIVNPQMWREGVQYARFTSVQVATGQAVRVSLLPGAGGGPCISGLQVLQSTPPTPPTITVQPAGRTVFEGADVAFQVTATGTDPLKYQWSFNGTNLPAATTDTLVVASAAVSAAGLYSVRVTNTEGAITSTAAPLTVVRFASNALINVNFGGHLTPEGLSSNKVGVAAIGQTTNDLWNFYSRDTASGQWKQDGSLSSLQRADGAATAAGIEVHNLPGAWFNGAVDPMYHGYLYPQSGNATLLVTNLPAGQYDVYLYSGQGNFQLQVGSVDYGVRTTHDVPIVNPQMWREGVQYARFTSVQVATGQAVRVSLLPGAGGGPGISGLQVLQSTSSRSPAITVQPAGRTVFEGADVAFQVTATGAEPLKYQWSFNGTNLPAATSDTLVVASAAVSAAGLYSVRVTNTEGAITSSDAPLTVVRFASNALINVNFGGHLTPEGLSSNKVGVAASGQTTNDLWNFYSRDTASGQWKQDGALSSLQRADGAVTAAGIEVHNLPGAWFNGAIDTMYHGYLYPQSGNATLLMTNLPAGQYDVYLYSGQGNFQLQVGSVDYGVRTTYDVPIVNPQMWREGVQYARFTSVQVATGQAVRVSLLPGAGGGPGISGLQVLQTTLATPPTITVQPAGQTVLAGATASFTATAVGTPPLSYQWRLNGTNLPGATGTLLTLSNVKPASAGNYSVSVTNSFGSALSSNATLTVILPCAPAPTNMVSWWRGEGNGWDQISGNNGVLVNGAGFEAGVVGQAFSFNGSSNSYLEVADSPALRLTNALTIECWAKRLNTSQVHILMEKGGDWTGGQANFELALNDTYSGGKHFGFSFAGGWRGCAVTPDTAWHHYAAVAVSGQTDPTLYIDGVPQTISYRGGAATMSLHASTRPLHIGAQVDPQTGWLYYSSTLIDEPAIFNRPLAASEIQAIYTAGSSGKCPAGVAPWIMTQPAGQTVVAGSAVTFTVSAAGTPQLRYQWRKGGSVLPGSSIPTLVLPTATTNDAGAYDVVISNPLGSVTSQVAMLTVRIPAPRTILNVNFAAYSQVKVGFAGTGLTPSDYWNNYTAPWQQFAGLSDLITADGTPTTVGLTVQNGAGHWGMDHPDLMYNCYCYSQDNGDVILTVTNLPSGTYDFYLYGHGGAANANTVFQLLLGGADRGSRSTGTNADWALTNWVEGAQYVVYRNVSATNGGAPVTIKAHPGLSGYAQLNGMQIALVNRLPVGPVSGPTIGGNAFGKLSMQFPWKDPSRAYWIQASTNLLDWMTVGSSIADGDGTVSYTDPDSDKRPTRFYRVMPQ